MERKMQLIEVIASTLLAGVFASAPAIAQTKVIFGSTSPMTLNYVPIVAAKGLGYFQQEGLDVELVEFRGTAMLLPQIANKRVDIGYPNPEVLIISRQPGRDPLPVKFFYNAARRSIWEFAVLADSPVKDLAGLKNGKVGVGALTFGNIPITKAIFKELKIEPDRDLTLVPVGIGSAAFLALRQKNIDALNLYDAIHVTMEQEGISIRRLEIPRKYAELVSNGFVAHNDTFRDNPQRLSKFGRAIAKTQVYCETNLAACVKAYWNVLPNKKPTSGDEEANLQKAVTAARGRLINHGYFPDMNNRLWGAYEPRMWKNFVAALYDGGQLSTKDINIDSLYTNSLVPEFNKFDVQAVVQAAKTAK